MKKNGFEKKLLKQKVKMRPKHLIMLLAAIILMIPLQGFSQKKISLNIGNTTLKTALENIKKLSGVNFVYNTKEVNDTVHVNVNVFEKTIEEVLTEVLKTTPYTFEKVKDYILITVKKQEPKQKVIKSITGVVTDEENLPMIGVAVMLDGTSLGRATDIDGKYQFKNVPQGGVLVFRFLGYETQRVVVGSLSVIDVKMEKKEMGIGEVVVTGYQVLNKERIAGAISTIRAKDLFFDGVTNLEQSLQGRLPGMVITNSSGLTGVRQSVRVRGTSTLMGSQEPIWVVDGIIQEDPLPFQTKVLDAQGGITDSNFDYMRNFVGSSISWLNPSDIESITVLKDASATAIYGVRAANGVIVINTKLHKGGPAKVSYSFGINVGERLSYEKLELMNSKDRVAVSREIFERGLISNWSNNNIGYAGLLNKYLNKDITQEEFNLGVANLETNNTDWFDILFRNPVSHNHSINISGGSDNTTYYSSVNYNSVNNTAIGNQMKSYSASIGISSFFSKRFKVAFRLTGSHSKVDGFKKVSPYSYASATNRVIPAYEDDGSLFYYQDATNRFLYNFINERDETGLTTETTNINTNLNLTYNVTKALRYESVGSLNISTVNGESYATEFSNYITAIRNYEYGSEKPNSENAKNSELPVGGEYNYDGMKTVSWNWRNSLSYNVILNKVHALTAMFGVEISSKKYDGLATTAYGYLRYRGKSFTQVPVTLTNPVSGAIRANTRIEKFSNVITDRLTNNMGIYMTLNYAYDNRYVVNFSVRNDASNRFGRYSNENFNPVYAGGVRWNVSREKWFSNQSIISDLNIRASFGYQRNIAENYSPSLIVKIPKGSASTITDINTQEELLNISSLPYTDLRWEKTFSSNFGLDMGLFDNKVVLGADYYRKKGTDMITVLAIPVEYGIDGMPVNGGSMENSGYELSAMFTPVRTKDFTWSLMANTSKNHNQITKVGTQNVTWRTAVTGSMYKEGYSSSAFWVFKCDGIDQNTGYPIIDLTTKEGSDPANDPTSYMVYAGKREADFTGGLNSQFRYKQLSLSLNFSLQIGGKKLLSQAYKSSTLPNEYENFSTELLNRWLPGDTDATFPGLPDSNVKNNILLPGSTNMYTNVYEMFNYSTARLVSASTLRCNNISLNYSLSERFAKKIFCKHITLGASMSNPFAIVSKDFRGRDAEVATGSQPRTRSYNLNLSLTF
ncbi:MAG: SusC/RagA family TonB-linked outer membrane protein [Eubacteriales bacterium]|nr:SusC/RagA family TonB-linked outer membrane protein [Eubacteriales bacterium]